MEDDLPPDLEDFEEVIEKVRPIEKEEKKLNKGYQGDYTKTTDELAEELSQKLKMELE